VPLVLRKVFTLRTDEPLLTVKTAPERQISQPLPLVYGMEFSIGEIAGDAEDRHMTISPPGTVKRLGEEGIFPEVTALRIVDGWRGFTLDISFSKPVTLWHFPVETISQSEGGVEMLYQGTAFLARVPLRGKGGLGGGLEMTMRFHGGTRG
jgi:alpha-amylase